MKRIYLLLALLPLLLLAACTSDDDLAPRPGETPLETLDRLVPITQHGAGTFGCLVNGEVWIPEVDGASDVAADATTGITNPNNMTISLRKEPISDSRNQLMTIGTVFRLLEKTPVKSFSFFYDADKPEDCVNITVETSLENFIRVDYYNSDLQIISGQFECTFREPECDDILNITNGRFDLRYRF